MTDSALLAREGDIATVTLNKPERLNALDPGTWRPGRPGVLRLPPTPGTSASDTGHFWLKSSPGFRHK